MNSHREYLESLGITAEALIGKVEKTLKAIERLCPEKVQDIFISDWMTGDNQRYYDNLLVFTKNYIIESSNFSTDPNIKVEISILKNQVEYILVKYNDYFDKANESSKLSIDFGTPSASFQTKAAKENCDKLSIIYDKYIKLYMLIGPVSKKGSV